MVHDKGPRVAVIGLGAMGLPMATHLATTFTVTGFEPHAPRREQAEQAGLHAESTPAAACAEADIGERCTIGRNRQSVPASAGAGIRICR
jgi:UDP-N-acetyl-D-mannosaminuronate dehydrogenase